MSAAIFSRRERRVDRGHASEERVIAMTSKAVCV